MGLKLTEIVQDAPAARVEPQVLVSAKLPVVATLAIESGVWLELVKFIDFAELV